MKMKNTAWIVGGAALISFAAGSLVTAYFTHPTRVTADSNRVFELNVYHAVPGKVPALDSRFRDASKLIAKHGLDVVGYWVPDDDPVFTNTFVYMVAAPSREELEKKWDAFHADPAFQEYRKAENANKLIEKVDSAYLRPTGYSALR